MQWTYENVSGRAEWLSRDPLGEGSDATLYSYVSNDPIDWNDLLGLARGNNPGWGGPTGNPNPSNSPLDTPLGGDIVGGAFVANLAVPVAAEVLTTQGVRIVILTTLIKIESKCNKAPGPTPGNEPGLGPGSVKPPLPGSRFPQPPEPPPPGPRPPIPPGSSTGPGGSNLGPPGDFHNN